MKADTVYFNRAGIEYVRAGSVFVLTIFRVLRYMGAGNRRGISFSGRKTLVWG